MLFNTNEEVEFLVESFENRTLSKAKWTHAAHLTVGLYYCFHYPFKTAKNLMSDGICRLNDAHGTPNTESSGYHETLTFFWLKIVADFLAERGREKGLSHLANELIASCNDAKLPLKFYSREQLFSVEARMNYIEPDSNQNQLGLTDMSHNVA